MNNFQAQAGDASRLLKLLANEQRLLILCHLIEYGELSVTALSRKLELSQSALSQHLARLREEGLVDSRRESQTIHYHVRDPKAGRIIALLQDMFCPDLGREKRSA